MVVPLRTSLIFTSTVRFPPKGVNMNQLPYGSLWIFMANDFPWLLSISSGFLGFPHGPFRQLGDLWRQQWEKAQVSGTEVKPRISRLGKDDFKSVALKWILQVLRLYCLCYWFVEEFMSGGFSSGAARQAGRVCSQTGGGKAPGRVLLDKQYRLSASGHGCHHRPSLVLWTKFFVGYFFIGCYMYIYRLFHFSLGKLLIMNNCIVMIRLEAGNSNFSLWIMLMLTPPRPSWSMVLYHVTIDLVWYQPFSFLLTTISNQGW